MAVRYEPTVEFWKAIAELNAGSGALVRQAADAGNAKAKAVIDFYAILYKRHDRVTEAMFLEALNDFKAGEMRKKA